MMSIRVCVADDHALFRRLISDMISKFDGIDPAVGEASNGKELLDLMTRHTYDVVVVDLSMPVMDGKRAAGHILKNHPNAKVVVLSMNDSPPVILDLMRMGVHGYLNKNVDPAEVEKAIKGVYRNDFYHNELTAGALRLAAKTKSAAVQPKRQNLSARELEILVRICSEQTSREISEDLHISPKTVEHHRISILKKVGVRNTVGLIKFAYEQGILSLDSSN
ncbi:MAG: response regulator [Cyclobacteriaceae bacterium]